MNFNTIPEALEDLRQGKIILVTDDPDRENEGDFICAAEFATTENINFMATHGKGLICMPMSEAFVRKLQFPQMVQDNTDNHETAFTVSIDHISTSTGISAAERSVTAMACVEEGARAEDFRRPGHMFPLLSKKNGVLEREGHTEATVDLCRLAGLKECGLCCEIMREDGTMMRTAELMTLAERFGIKFITIRDLQAYRKCHEKLVDQVTAVNMPTKYGDFNHQLTVYSKDATTDIGTTGGGHNGSNNFAVHYGYADNSGYGLTEASLPTLTFADGTARVIDHMYVNNMDYALNCYIDGNGLTAKIGDDDWVKLVATGYNAAGEKTGTASIYLCNGPKNIMMDWTKWDLSGLGKVLKVTFNVTGSSDNGYGFSQPAYFAYDDVAVRFEKAAAVVPATGVTLDKTTLNLMTGETAVLTAAAQPENTTDTLTWTTGNEAVATVADGVVTAVGAGSTVITATCGSVKAECTVTVTASPLTVSVGGKTSPLSRVGGEGETKYRAVLPYGSDVTIHVADASFLLVTDKKSNYLNDAGVNPFTLKAAELETALLTDKDEKPFTPAENSKVAYLSIMDVMAGTTYELYLELTREVTPATGVTLDQTELTLTAGKTASLKATVQPENTTDTIVWSSSKEEVATVENGMVTAKAAGETVITATCGTVKAECAVTVTPPVMASAVTLDKTELNLYTGDTAALTAAIQPENTTDPTIAWTTTDAEVASVQNGVVTAGKTGTATITASCGEAKAQCAVTVKAPAEPAQKDGVYQIGNADELVWFVRKVNGGENAISAILAKDIDLADVVWAPIGNGSVAFAGSFDGAGHTVSNLTVDYTTAASGERLYLGLFGQVEGTPEKHAVIQNLTVTGSVNAASEFSVYTGYVAGVVGSARYAELSKVISRVDVTADERVGSTSSVGGLAGVMIDTTVTNCGNEGDVTGVNNLGGLCYELYSGTMTGCYNTGRITATGTYVGGLMGYAKQATITNAYSTGSWAV